MTSIDAATGTNPAANNGDMTIMLTNLAVGLALSLAVKLYYTRLSKLKNTNREFADIFPILTGITFMVIYVVQSSVALSLGLLGAMSIVRFRTPIREAHELTFIFLSIAIGLSTGAGYLLIPAVITAIILGLDFHRSRSRRALGQNRVFKLDIKSPRIVDSHINAVQDRLQQNHLSVVKLEIKKNALKLSLTTNNEGFHPEDFSKWLLELDSDSECVWSQC